MSQPWDSSIRALRARVLLASALATLETFALPASVFVLLYLGATKASPWAQFLAPWVALLLGAALLAALFFGLLSGRHSDLYLAKWIDKQSGLEDRLSSAVEWSRLQALDDFQRRCIEQLALQVGAKKWALVLPPTAPKRWPVTIVALVIIAAAPIAFLRRPRAAIERDARTVAVLLRPIARSAAQQAEALRVEAKQNQDAELEGISNDLSQLLRNIDEGKSTREDSFRQLDRIRAQVARGRPGMPSIAKLGASTDAGPVGALSRALATGDRTGTEAALGALATALEKEALDGHQLDELRTSLRALTELAQGTPSASPGLAEKLESAAQHAASGDQAGVAQQLGEIRKGMPSLDKTLASIAALRKADAALQRVSRALDASGEPEPSENILRGAGGDGTNTAPPEVSDTSGQAGLSGQKDGRVGTGPASPESGPELAVRGTWSGKVMRQFFDSTSAAAATDDIKKLLVEHERVVTNRLDRDEVPIEYQEAVRAYFAVLHQKGR